MTEYSHTKRCYPYREDAERNAEALRSLEVVRQPPSIRPVRWRVRYCKGCRGWSIKREMRQPA